MIPIIETYIKFEIAQYDSYILALVLLFTPMMLGIVMGFMILDDKDAKIVELISITPLGKSGYLINRLIFLLIPSAVYILINYYIMGIYLLDFVSLIFVMLLSSIFAFADLFEGNIIKSISMLFPTYWISRVIRCPNDIISYVNSTITVIFWLLIFVNIYNRNTRDDLN